MKYWFQSDWLLKRLGLRGLRRERRGAVVVILALSAILIIAAVGAGVDLMTAYNAQQKLSETAALACQYASTSQLQGQAASDYNSTYDGAGGLATFNANVNNFITTTLTQEHFNYPQTTGTPYVGNTGGTGTVTLTAKVPTSLMSVVGFKSVPIGATQICQPNQPGNGSTGVESFESNIPCGSSASTCYIQALHSSSSTKFNILPVSKFPPSTAYAYVGDDGWQWLITGYCLEIDLVGAVSASLPNGQHAVELDCDNGNGTAGNSAISTSLYLPAHNYELRYWYRSRIDYPNYDPAYICGSSAADTSWANDNAPRNWPAVTRTNQINVYLDTPLSDGTAPLHTTLDGQEQLAGQNMIDECVYAANWIQRSVRITITTPNHYWLTFAADGANDSYGGQLDDIQLCEETCSGAVQDNYPSASVNPNYPGGSLNSQASLAVNDGFATEAAYLAAFPDWSSKPLLFEDSFEPATQSSSGFANLNLAGDLSLSYGTTGGSPPGWPNATATGWNTAAANQVIYVTKDAAQGSQYVWLTAVATDHNRITARPFVLVPGYYNLTYDYVSQGTFPALTQIVCAATPNVAMSNLTTTTGTGSNRTTGTAFSAPRDTNTLAAFIANGQIVSTPTSVAEGQTTLFTNPATDLSVTPPVATPLTTTAAVKMDNISLTNYTASTTSALLDICAYSSGWTTRSVNFEITKTGTYWLAFSTDMASPGDWSGGAFDDVRLTALGSPAMASPPSNPVVVPVPSPQNSTVFAFSGFEIVQDPIIFPAPIQ